MVGCMVGCTSTKFSIMPTMLSANLHSGATLIGEKGSDLVLGREPLETINLDY